MQLQGDARNQARWKIIQEVNKYKLRFRLAPQLHPRMLGMKNIQWAVYIARRNKLVNNATLEEAGYRGID